MWLALVLNASLGEFWRSTVKLLNPEGFVMTSTLLDVKVCLHSTQKGFLQCYVYKKIIWQQGNLQVAVIRRAFAATFFQRRRRRSSRAAAVHADGQVSFAQAVSGVRHQHLKPLNSYIIKRWFHIRVMAQISLSETHGSVGSYGPHLTFYYVYGVFKWFQNPQYWWIESRCLTLAKRWLLKSELLMNLWRAPL